MHTFFLIWCYFTCIKSDSILCSGSAGVDFFQPLFLFCQFYVIHFVHLLRAERWEILSFVETRFLAGVNKCVFDQQLDTNQLYCCLLLFPNKQTNKQKHSPCSRLHRMYFTEVTF